MGSNSIIKPQILSLESISLFFSSFILGREIQEHVDMVDLWGLMGNLCSGLLFILREEGGPRAWKMQEDWWQEMEVFQRCIPRLQVLWAPYAPWPQPFKKACGISNNDTIFVHRDISYRYRKQQQQQQRSWKLPWPSTECLKQFSGYSHWDQPASLSLGLHSLWYPKQRL